MTREDAIDNLEELWDEVYNEDSDGYDYAVAIDMAIEALSADRPMGEWIFKGDYAECSECGGSSGTQYDGVEPIPRITAFCPHCGADMRKETE